MPIGPVEMGILQWLLLLAIVVGALLLFTKPSSSTTKGINEEYGDILKDLLSEIRKLRKEIEEFREELKE